MFSGGDYDEVERWLLNFVTSHARRESTQLDALVLTDGERDGTSYGVQLRLGSRLSPVIDLAYKDIAEQRGSLAWCSALAARVRGWARELLDGAHP